VAERERERQAAETARRLLLRRAERAQMAQELKARHEAEALALQRETLQAELEIDVTLQQQHPLLAIDAAATLAGDQHNHGAAAAAWGGDKNMQALGRLAAAARTVHDLTEAEQGRAFRKKSTSAAGPDAAAPAAKHHHRQKSLSSTGVALVRPAPPVVQAGSGGSVDHEARPADSPASSHHAGLPAGDYGGARFPQPSPPPPASSAGGKHRVGGHLERFLERSRSGMNVARATLIHAAPAQPSTMVAVAPAAAPPGAGGAVPETTMHDLLMKRMMKHSS
jgi:hypothetical protein